MAQPEANAQPGAVQASAGRTREFALLAATLIAFLILGVSQFRSGATPSASNADILAKLAARSTAAAVALLDERSAILPSSAIGQDAASIAAAQSSSDQEMRALRAVLAATQSRAGGAIDLKPITAAVAAAGKLPEQRKAASTATTDSARQAVATFYDGLIENLLGQARSLGGAVPQAQAAQIAAAVAVTELIRDGESERLRVVTALSGGDIPASLPKDLEALRDKQKRSLEALRGSAIASAIDQVFQDKPAAELTRLRGLLSDNGQQLGFKGAGSIWWDTQGEVLTQLRAIAGDAATQLDIPSGEVAAASGGSGLGLLAVLVGAAAVIGLVLLPKPEGADGARATGDVASEAGKGDKQEIKNLRRAVSEAQTRERDAAQKADRRIAELEADLAKQEAARTVAIAAATEPLQKDIAALKRQIEAASKEAASGTQARQLSASEEQLSAAKAELSAASEARAALERELAEVRRKVSATEAILAEQRTSDAGKQSALQTTIRQLTADKAELAATVAARDASINDLQARNKELAFGREVLFKQLREREAAPPHAGGSPGPAQTIGRDSSAPLARDADGGTRERIDLGELLKQLEALAPPPEKK